MNEPVVPGIAAHNGHIKGIGKDNGEVLRIQNRKVILIKHSGLPFFPDIAESVLSAEEFFFLMQIAAKVNIISPTRNFLSTVLFSLIESVNTDFLSIIPPFHH